MTPEITSKVDLIVAELEQVTLLSAAWDCMTDAAKARFRKQLELIMLAPRCGSSPGPR